MDLHLDGKRALVTGASKGIGLGCAIALAAEGVAVELAARRKDVLEERAAEIRDRHGVKVGVHAVDLSLSADQAALVDAVGDVDILVNNAGAIPGGDLAVVDEETWRDAWDLKVFGYVNLCRAYYPRMVTAGGGVIVNVIGAAAIRPSHGYIAGGVGNAGLDALSRALGAFSLRDGVRVVGVHPGLIITDRMTDLLRQRAEERFGDEGRWEELVPEDPKPGTVEQVADVVTFLASDRASHVSGTTFAIDGGATAR